MSDEQAPTNAPQRPDVYSVVITMHKEGYSLRILGVGMVTRYYALKPTLEEAKEELNNWMKGIIVW